MTFYKWSKGIVNVTLTMICEQRGYPKLQVHNYIQVKKSHKIVLLFKNVSLNFQNLAFIGGLIYRSVWPLELHICRKYRFHESRCMILLVQFKLTNCFFNQNIRLQSRLIKIQNTILAELTAKRCRDVLFCYCLVCNWF